jgi:hypothetical protein
MDTTTTLIPDPTEAAPVFYSLPAVSLQEGMSTADGQDVLDVGETDQYVLAHVYTPADDAAEDEERQGAPEARIYQHDQRVDMADFVNTNTPGRGHPDALVRLTLSPAELRPGDLVAGLATPVVGVEPTDGHDVELGRQYRIDLADGDSIDSDEHATVTVLRASGVIEEVVVTDLEADAWYRNHGDESFFDVENLHRGDEDDDEDLNVDDVVVESSNGNRAVYDSSAMVQRWSAYK